MDTITETMFPYQVRALDRLRPMCAALALRYGAGKSWIALRYLKTLNRSVMPGKASMLAVIFCKKRNILTWQREIRRRIINPTILVGPKGLQTLLRAPYAMAHDTILLLSHNQIRLHEVDIVALLREYNVAGMIMDESTAIKNPKAQVTEAALRISNHAPAAMARIALSGRMMPEGPNEIWSQYQWLYPVKNPLGPTHYSFLRKWFIKTDYAWALDLMKTKEFYAIVNAHSIYMTQEDLAELAEAIGIQKERYVIEMYEESAEQRRILNYLYDNWALPTMYTNGNFPLEQQPGASEQEEYDFSISLMMKAQQIASGFYYTDHGKATMYLRHQPKIKLLVEVITQLLKEDPDRRIIVWHRFKAEEGSLQLAIAAGGCGCVIGPYPEALLSFSNPGQRSPRVILMPSQSSQGYNELTLADTNIFFSNVHSSELRDQAEKRINRLGQQNKIITHIDIASPRQEDLEVVTALQVKDLTPARLKTIIMRRHHRKGVNSC